MDRALRGKTVALCVSGSIAAYKAVEVARRCLAAGARIVPVMTASAAKFIGPVTLAGITGESVATDMWDATFAGEMHVSIADRVDAVLLVPATADLIARLAAGRADDLVTALALCARTPVLAAPAMHPRMWEHPATRRNVETVSRDGRVTWVGPVSGPVASGDVGMGRMAEPEEIVAALAAAFAPHDLGGLRLVVTAGPTVEDLDPVRFLGNRSTGKMGFAIAERAAARGAHVTLVTGPVSLRSPSGVRRIDVRGALAMRDVLWELAGEDLSRIDALVMAAAVADYRVAQPSATKVKKQGERASIELLRNPDIIAEFGAARTSARPVLVGFAVETGDEETIVAYARDKLASKKVDFVVANEARQAFGSDSNVASIVTDVAAEALGAMPKHLLADAILDRVKSKLG
jgi:phosphopantothenoylcysteine decarboxylase/phosphopantothenate--cysteine ligase